MVQYEYVVNYEATKKESDSRTVSHDMNLVLECPSNSGFYLDFKKLIEDKDSKIPLKIDGYSIFGLSCKRRLDENSELEDIAEEYFKKIEELIMRESP